MNTVVIDVDGVMTDGTFWYSEAGKVMKRFGPDDSDALKVLRRHFRIEFVTADHRGYKITQRRITKDMGFRLHRVGELDRQPYLEQMFSNDCVFIADGFLDAPALAQVTYAIAPANAHDLAKDAADYICARPGGHGAVAEACQHLLYKFKNRDLYDREVPE
jgi:3-deoxy-D-manno-octulosonate 8-phosphate phosphatase (KDO 8-P phosphatase)